MNIADLKIAVAQMHPVPGAVRTNLERMLGFMQGARDNGAHLVVFPELSTSGYVLGDQFFENDAFIEEIARANEEIVNASNGLIVIWGSIVADRTKIGEDGRLRKYNAACIAQNGRRVSNGRFDGWIPKTNLPKYRIFDDARYFYPADKLAAEWGVGLGQTLSPFTVSVGGEKVKLGLTVCEDLWEDEYATKPSRIYAKHGADLIINVSASPWTAGKWRARDRMLTNRVKDASIPILYVNAVGLENNTKNLIWFDGSSALVGRDGAFHWRAPQHTEGLFLVKEGEGVSTPMPSELEEIHAVIPRALRSFKKPSGRVVIGLSGGIDSAVSAALAADAFGPDNVLTVNMPTKFNSRTTQELAATCARNLNLEYRAAPIQGVVDSIVDAVMKAGFPRPEGLAYENLQARTRGADILALVAQMEHGVFLNNGNKTELALNYLTLYGDGAGWVSMLGDVWKGQVYGLARLINERAGWSRIPEGIIDIVPSAELSAEQNVDEGKGDPIFYPYHDELLAAFIERRWDAETVLGHARTGTLDEALGCAGGTVRKYFPTRAGFVQNLEWCWTRFNTEWKRGQLPPVLICSRHAFGFDRRAPIADGYFTRQYAALKASYLQTPDARP